MRKIHPIFLMFLMFLTEVMMTPLKLKSTPRRIKLKKLTAKTPVSLAVVLPHSMFMKRDYTKKIIESAMALSDMDFVTQYELSPFLEMMEAIPSPMEVLNKICRQFLANRTAAVMYLTNNENYGRDTVAGQYFIHLTRYVGLPVISWNADNSGYEQPEIGSLQLQLAPTMKHQVAAIISILERYGWHKIFIITGQIAGHRNFEQNLREMIGQMPESSRRIHIIDALTVTEPPDLIPVTRTEARVFVLYSTKSEAVDILTSAAKLGLTRKTFVWIAMQSVIGTYHDVPDSFPIGMLGVHFKTDTKSMIDQISNGMEVMGHALEALTRSETLNIEDKRNLVRSGSSCEKWNNGENLFKYLKNVSVPQKNGSPPLQFTSDGSKKSVDLRIVNLQPHGEDLRRWEEIGVWQSLATSKDKLSTRLDIKDIVWPGNALKPPEGIPEKRFLRVSFLEEDPYILLGPPSTCKGNKGVICQMVDDDKLKGLNKSEELTKENSTFFQCCSGFCVDLLNKFSADLSFDFEMIRVKDGKWGGIIDGQWNGLVKELINHETDIVMTSLKINSGREKVIDFSVPFLETGITILVAKRTGIISPTAFLEPFDMISWLLVALVAIQIAAGFIFTFEWISPSGYDMKFKHPQSKFSFLRTLWLVWAVLFQAAVNVDCPQGYTSRFMAHIWSLFALIFLAIYTANLAAFMITREEFPDLVGIDDRRLTNPTSVKPAFRFGTIPNGATDYIMKNNFPEMHRYMNKFNRSTVKEGFKSIKNDELHAFIYDATVLEYLVGQDDECDILTVGSWYAMTGYGVAFPKGSPWVPLFNNYLMLYRENGDLERMQNFWFTGACEPTKRKMTSSKPLALAQFTSAFLLLGIGIVFSASLLLLEILYFQYGRKRFPPSSADCCNLISMSLSESIKEYYDHKLITTEESRPNLKLTYPESCGNPVCEKQISAVFRELRAVNRRVERLRTQLRSQPSNAFNYLRNPTYDKTKHKFFEIETAL